MDEESNEAILRDLSMLCARPITSYADLTPMEVEACIRGERITSPNRRGPLITTDFTEPELAAMALGNALLFRALGIDDDGPVLAILEEVLKLLEGQTLRHDDAALLVAPVLDRLLAKIQAQT